jgi:iron-sulfur cluster assembly accessory protein
MVSFLSLSQTERAADRIKNILAGESAAGALGIRLGVKRRGCNGLSYTLNYALEKPEKDIEMQCHGVKVYIEPMALFSVVGTVMDWEESELASEFTFNNPNSKGECGCGESFTV